MSDEELRALVERVASVDLVADQIRELARELSPSAVSEALALASELREIDAATALALVTCAQGGIPGAETVERIYPDAIDERAAQLLIAAHPERREILTRLLGSRRPDRYQLAVAAALYLHLHPDETPPPVLLEVLRTLSRARPGWVGEGWAVQAVLRLKDPDLDARYRIDPRRDVLDETIFDGLRDDPGVDALPASRSKVLASGFTARRATPKVGRNDPCPCGSGKKYKKCHWGKEDPSLSPVAGLTMREYRRRMHEVLDPEELAKQHPADLARLPFEELGHAQARKCFEVFLDCERMEEAEALVEQLATRDALGDGLTVDDYRADLIEFAHEYGHDDLVTRQLERLADPSVVSEHVRLGRALRQPDAQTLPLLESYCRPHFTEGGRPPMRLAYELLEPYPALGIVFTRGCLDPEHEADSRTLLGEIEWARDRLGTSPEDPYWTVLDRMVLERKLDRASDAEKEALRAELERLREDAKEARAQAYVFARELDQQRSQLDELEARAADAEERAEAAKADDDAASAEQEAEQARRLRRKIEQLQARIREGQAERADLRRRAEELASAQQTDEEEAPRREPPSERGEVVTPHGVRVPVWSDKARSSLDKLPKNVVASAIAVSGALGAGRPEAWRHAKRLEGLHGLCAARVGIHHRLLFRMDEDGLLDVDEVVTREDLDRALSARR